MPRMRRADLHVNIFHAADDFSDAGKSAVSEGRPSPFVKRAVKCQPTHLYISCFEPIQFISKQTKQAHTHTHTHTHTEYHMPNNDESEVC